MTQSLSPRKPDKTMGVVAVDPDLRALVAEVFEIPLDQVSADLTPDQVVVWDSLNHLRLVTEVESRFDVHFSMIEIQEMGSIGDLDRILAGRKQAG